MVELFISFNLLNFSLLVSLKFNVLFYSCSSFMTEFQYSYIYLSSDNLRKRIANTKTNKVYFIHILLILAFRNREVHNLAVSILEKCQKEKTVILMFL